MSLVNVSANLSHALADQLSSTFKAWAVYFDAGGVAQWTALTQEQNTVGMESRGGLKLYFILQDTSKGATPVHTGGTGPGNVTDPIQTESQIVAVGPSSSAYALNYRYDSFEVSFTGSKSDAGDLTDINGFGIPIELSVGYGTGTTATSTATRGYNLSGGTVSSAGIWHDLASAGGSGSIQYFAGTAPSTDHPRMAISPATAIGNGVAGTNYSLTQWSSYISSLHSGSTSSATTSGSPGQIQIAGFFNGAPDGNGIYHNPGFYAYDVTYSNASGAFVLTPGSTSQIKGDITITAAELANSIYLTLGNATISGLADPNGLGNTATLSMNTGANTEWGAVLRDFIAGFSVGHWNTTATSVNSLVSGNINLNKEWNQDGTYSFGGSIASGAGSVTAALGNFYDPYAKVFFLNTNSYGTGYSDFAARGATAGPLINVTNGVNTGASKFITLTLFADTDPTSGYTSQTFNNYISASTYLGANYIDSSSAAPPHQLTFGVGTMALDPDTPVTIVLKSAGAGGADERIPLVHGGATVNHSGYASAGSYGANYAIASTGAGYSATYTGVNNAGIVSIDHLPVYSGTAGVMWYQIEVGSSGTAAYKVFNLYETVNASGQILNPAYSGQSRDLAIDGLAAATGVFGGGTVASQQQYISGTGSIVQVGFQNGGTDSLDPSLMAVVSSGAFGAANLYQPTAPLVGMRPGYTSLSGAPFLEMSQPWNGSSPTTVYNGGLVFGWTGADSAAVSQQAAVKSSYVSAITNKIGAGNVARLSFTSVSGAALPVAISGGYLTATADADGVWATSAPVSFGSGTYTVQLQEFLATDSAFASPLNSASIVQSFTVSQGAAVDNGQTLVVSSGQSSTGLVVSAGGNLTVSSGGVATGALVSAGGVMRAAGGSGDTGSIILGQHYISSGASAANMTIASGGKEYVYGATSGASVYGGGVQVVGGGGGATGAIATSTYVNSGSHQHVKSAGSAVGTVVLSGGVLAIDSSGIASTMTTYDGAVVHVSSGGMLNGGTMSGGTLEVFVGGSVGPNAVTLMPGSGLVQVWSGGATAANLTLQTGNHMFINSGATAAATANAGAQIVVSSGGSGGPGITANNYGEIWVYSGGWAQPTLNLGVMNALGGATVFAATVNQGGIEDVQSGATTTNATIFSGGYEYVHNGATATNTNVRVGGHQWVWSAGAAANGTQIQSAGEQNVYLGATASGTQVSSGGTLRAWDSGTIVSGATVSSGGGMIVHTSATANNVALNGGMVEFHSAGSGSVVIGAAGSIVRLGNDVGSGVAVSGFTSGMGTIDFDEIGYSPTMISVAWAQSTGSGTLQLTSGMVQAAVTLFGTYATSNFQLGTDGHGTTVVVSGATGALESPLVSPHG